MGKSYYFVAWLYRLSLKRFSGLIFVVLFLFTTQAVAQQISLNQYLDTVRASHPFFTQEALSVDVQKKDREKYLGSEDWVIKSDPYLAHQENETLSSFTPSRVDQAQMNLGAQRLYWDTGGVLTMKYSTTFTDQEGIDIVIPIPGSPTGDLVFPADSGQFYENELSISYYQPLMQNSGGLLSRLAYDLQGYNIEVAEIVALENQEGFLLEVAIKFVDWALLTEQYRIINQRLIIAKEELARTNRKRKQNLVAQVDVIRAKESVLNVEQGLLKTKASMLAKRAELATISQDESILSSVAQFNLYSSPIMPPFELAAQTLKNSSRSLKIFNVRLRQLDKAREGEQELEKPELGMNVAGGLTSGASEYGDSLDHDNQQFSASLQYSYPLGNNTAKANLAKNVVEKSRVREEIKNVGLKLESNLANLLTHLDELGKVLEVNKKRIAVAKEKTLAENKRYEQGRSELTFVLQSRDQEYNAQLTLAQNGALYHKLRLQYLALMDLLLPDQN